MEKYTENKPIDSEVEKFLESIKGDLIEFGTCYWSLSANQVKMSQLTTYVIPVHRYAFLQ